MLKQTAKFMQLISRQQPIFSMSESRLALKRDGEAKLAQKIKEAIDTTYIKVKDISIGSSSCIYSFNLGGQMYNITVES